MSEAFLRFLTVQSIAGGVLILVMLALRKFLGHKMSQRWLYALWLIVALRLFVPLELPTFLSFQADNAIPVQQAHVVTDIASADAATVNDISLLSQTQPIERTITDHSISEQAAENTIPPLQTTATRPALSLPQALVLVWCAGAAAMAAYTHYVNLRWRKRVFQNAMPLRTALPLPVWISDVPSPCLIGTFKPVVVLNKQAAQPENLPFALAHEWGHYRGLDHVWNLLRSLLLTLFWFHPLVWVAVRLSKKDCERACDERVIRMLGTEKSIPYARTLIALVSPVQAFGSASFMATNLKDMKQRVLLVADRRHAKRWACALFAAILVLTSVASFATGTAGMREIELPRSFTSTPAYYPTASGLWLAVDGCLYKQNSDNTYVEIAQVASASLLAADSQAVYILDTQQNQILMLNTDGKQQKAWALPSELTHLKIEVAGNKLALLCGLAANWDEYRQYTEAKLYLLNKQDGALTEVKIGNVVDICADGSGNLLTVHMPTPGLVDSVISRLNPQNLSTSFVTDTYYNASITAEPGAIYILTSTTLSCYDEKTGITTQLMKGAGVLTSMTTINGVLYAWNRAEKRLVAMDVSTNRTAGKTVLTLINQPAFAYQTFESAREAFVLRHPDVEVQLIEMGDQQMFTGLMAGDADIDIVSAPSGKIREMGRAGALASLSDSPVMMNALGLADWLPFETLYSENGKLYGLPAIIMYNFWSVDADLSQQTGFAMPAYPYTWQDVYEAALAAGIGQPGKPVLLYDRTANPYVIAYYTLAEGQRQGKVNFDTPGFRADMAAYKKMVEQGIISLSANDGSVPALIQTFGDISDHSFPSPTVNGKDTALVNSYGYCVNNRSANRELALELLAEIAKPEHQYKSNYGHQETMMLMDVSGYDPTLYQNPLGLARYTQHVEDMRQFAGNNWVTWNPMLHPVRVLENSGEAFDRYLAGSISLDEVIRILQARADLIQYE